MKCALEIVPRAIGAFCGAIHHVCARSFLDVRKPARDLLRVHMVEVSKVVISAGLWADAARGHHDSPGGESASQLWLKSQRLIPCVMNGRRASRAGG